MRILVADGSAGTREYLTTLLSEHWDIDIVPDGVTALEVVHTQPPDCILAGVKLPGVDGFALARALSASIATRGIPVLLLSVHADRIAIVDALGAGSDDPLILHVTGRELVARVQSHLELARVHGEVAARAAELDAFFEATTDGAFILAADGCVMRMNEPARILLGVSSLDPVTGSSDERYELSAFQAFDGTPLAKDQLPTARLLRGEQLVGTNALTVRVQNRDGASCIVELSGVPLRDATGGVVGAVAIARDVTRLERAETALAEQKRLFLTLVEQVPDVITRFDHNLRHTYVNPAAEAVTGIPPLERIGKTYGDLGFPEAVYGPWEQALREVFAFGQPRAFDTEYQAPGERVQYSRVRYIPEFAPDGSVASVWGITTDVTTLKQAETALQQSEERVRTAFHASSTAITITSVTTNRIVDANEAASRLTGYSRDEMVGRTVRELNSVEQADLERLRVLRREQTPIRDVPVRIQTKSGDVRICLVSSEPIWLNGEESIITVCYDVTERMRAVQALAEATAALEVSKREEERRRHEAERREQIAESLRDVLAVVNSRRRITEVLEYIARQAGRLLDSDAVAIYTSDVSGSDAAATRVGPLTLQAASGLLANGLSDWSERRPASVHAGLRTSMTERRPVVILRSSKTSGQSPGSVGPDAALVDAMMEATAGYVTIATGSLPAPYHALLVIPIVAQDQVYGGILLLYSELHQFAAGEVALAMAYADQIALAIANARLQDHIDRAARDSERNRIARELHDTVTQEIFSASLLAEAIPRIWDEHRTEAERSLGELHQLTRGALAALRTLLLELRPAVFEERELGYLVHQLGDALAARAGVPIEVTVSEEYPAIPNAVKFALYRIAQEALTNSAKHSAATRITARLSGGRGGKGIRLEVTDDGQGFDTGAVRAGRFGIGLLRERARLVGASAQIRSRPGQGTRVVVEWNANATCEDATSG
jgi:two-component system nitrate/nitrite sensor histidine kinase NarX